MHRLSNLKLPRKLIWLLTASLTAIVLTGCGRERTAGKDASPTASVQTEAGDATTKPDPPEQDSAAGSGRKPCESMNRADAEAAVGQPLPQTTENIELGGCGYNSADFSYGADLNLGDWEYMKGAATSGAPNGKLETISGVGDEALYQDRPASILYVRKGSKGFALSLHGPTPTSLPGTPLEQEKLLTLKILPKL